MHIYLYIDTDIDIDRADTAAQTCSRSILPLLRYNARHESPWDNTLGMAVRAERENNSDKAGGDKPTATYDGGARAQAARARTEAASGTSQ